ncbi:hypothetical protein B0H16DRAFT_359542 [Mycena metata]|uniref:Uncharacterized protein n=1 Tax=Mycena metata TaxID=1033252 RepID=A0AAD7MLI8_9AGAR|nr:hypothetical protein B0H16DRAFT_359542 [Mycena metata]
MLAQYPSEGRALPFISSLGSFPCLQYSCLPFISVCLPGVILIHTRNVLSVATLLYCTYFILLPCNTCTLSSHSSCQVFVFFA